MHRREGRNQGVVRSQSENRALRETQRRQKGKAGMQGWEEGSRIQAFAGQGEARVALAYGF